MILNEHYWYFESVIPEKTCDDIVKYCLQMNDVKGITGNKIDKPYTKKELKNIQKLRDSNVVFIDEPWLYNQIFPFLRAANKNAKWNFELNWTEALQFTKYKKGQYYGWHVDQSDHPYTNRPPQMNGKIRKLSSSLILSDEKDYKGGELEFAFFSHPDRKKTYTQVCNIRKKGSIIVFPSFIWHRVKPVTKGVRYSLVSWSLGYPYR